MNYHVTGFLQSVFHSLFHTDDFIAKGLDGKYFVFHYDKKWELKKRKELGERT